MISSRDKLIQVTFLHWVYYTSERLQRIFPECNPVCPCCRLRQGSYIHMFWECPSIMSYWEAVFAEINLRLQFTLTPTPSLALLGIPDDEQHPHHSKLLISYLLYYAKKEIQLKWLPPHQHDVAAWEAMVNAALPLYKMTYSNKGCHWKFEKVWSPWTQT